VLNRRDLTDRVLEQSAASERKRMLPDLVVMKLGGQSIMDRGAPVVLPLIDVIARAASKVPLLICTGGGTRARHAYQLGLDLGLPTGVLSTLASSVAKQNARMVQMLLADRGGVYVAGELLEQLPAYVDAGQIPIMAGMPPFEYWTLPPAAGRIPEARTDTGTFLLAEVLGASRLIFVKDEDGLYSADPKKNPDAEFLGDIGLQRLLEMDLDDLIVERCMLQAMAGAHFVREITIVNGFRPTEVAAAIEGGSTGSRIFC